MTVPDASAWLPAALAVRLGSVALALALAKHPAASRWAAFGGSLIASLLTGALACAVLASGQSRRRETCCGMRPRASVSASRWIGSPPGSSSSWRLLAVPIAIYSLGYVAHGALGRRSAFVGVGFSVLVGAVEMVFAADGVIVFLFAWELMTLANAALVATEHESPESRRAAFLYLAMSHVATGCLIAGFLVVSAFTGSLSLPQITRRLPLRNETRGSRLRAVLRRASASRPA